MRLQRRQRTATLLAAMLAFSCRSENAATYDLRDLGRCATIDNSIGDDGFLERTRAALKNRKRLHTTSDAAVDNLLDCGRRRPVGIVGHGIPGGLIFSFDLGNTISIADSSWEGKFKELHGRIGMVTILSCDTGSEEDGAKLLRRISDLTGVRVRARTGFTYADTDGAITFEDNSDWQVADPPPAGIPPIKHRPRHSMFKFSLRHITLGQKEFLLGDIQNVKISGYSSSNPQKSAVLMSLHESAAQDAMSSIHFRSEFKPRGEPAAMVTAVAELTLKTENGLITRKVEIYNDRIARDVIDRTRFFDIDPKFGQALATARHAHNLF